MPHAKKGGAQPKQNRGAPFKPFNRNRRVSIHEF